MNIFQIMKQARYEVDAMRASGTVTGLWSDEEVISSINVGMDQAARLLRLANSDILTTTVNSTQTAAIDMITEQYAPTSLRIQPNVTSYLLPPDFVRIASIRTVTAGYEGVRFRPLDASSPTFLEQANIPASALATAELSDDEYGYAVTGARSLMIVPTPLNTFDLEIRYHYRPPKLLAYNTGTAQRINALLAGSGTAWVSQGLRGPAEIDLDSATYSVIDLGRYYSRITSFTTDIIGVLSRDYGVDSVAVPYKIGMVPLLPEEHHLWLAQVTAANLMRKVNLDISTKMVDELSKQLMQAVQPEFTVRQIQESLIIEPYEIPWP